jgi:tetratricopeptide (TPR) repeat protein
LSRGDHPAAVKLLSRATALLGDRDPGRLEMLCHIADSLTEMGEFARAAAIVSEALDGARSAADERMEWHARLADAALRSLTDPGDIAANEDIARRAIEVFERFGDDRGLARAWNVRASTLWVRGRARETVQAVERVLEYAGRAADHAQESQNVIWLLYALMLGPTPLVEVLERSWELAETYRGRPIIDAELLSVGAREAANDGRLDEARRLQASARAKSEELGHIVVAAAMSAGSAIIELTAGDLEAAERVLREGFETLDRLGEKSYLSTNTAELASVLADLGRNDEAEEFCRIAKDSGDPIDASTQWSWRYALAKVMAARGREEEALELAAESLALVDDSDLLDSQGIVRLSVARTYRLLGRTREAAAILRQALERFETKGSRDFAKMALERLAELEA